MSVRVQRLLHLCQAVCVNSRICRCPHLSSRYSVGFFQSCRLKSSSFILGQSEVLLQDGIEIQELPWVIRRLDPREFPFVSTSGVDGRRYICGVKDEQFVQQLQECVTIHEVSLHYICPVGHSLISQQLYFFGHKLFFDFVICIFVWQLETCVDYYMN